VPDALFVSEIFESVQGEGIRLGVRQVFVRLAGCNLRCRYCDTPLAMNATPAAAIVRNVGGQVTESNPVEAARVMELVNLVSSGAPMHSVSWTGGEPLLQPEGLRRCMELAREMGLRNYLETNGTLAKAVARVAPLADFIAADVKLPSASGAAFDPEAVRAFLSAAAGSGLFVKAVVSDESTPEEISAAAEVVAAVNSSTPMVIQPVTCAGGVKPPGAEGLLGLQAAALVHLDDVRVIAQMHKKLGLL